MSATKKTVYTLNKDETRFDPIPEDYRVSFDGVRIEYSYHNNTPFNLHVCNSSGIWTFLEAQTYNSGGANMISDMDSYSHSPCEYGLFIRCMITVKNRNTLERLAVLYENQAKSRRSRVLGELAQQLHNIRDNGSRCNRICIGYFVPGSVFEKKMAIFERHTASMVVRDGYEFQYEHPYSEKYNAFLASRAVIKNRPAGRLFEVVDNSSSEIETYYTFMGSDCVPIARVRDKSRESGLYVTIANQNDPTTSVAECKVYPLEEGLEQFGIYQSEELARTKGDVAKLEEMRLIEMRTKEAETQERLLKLRQETEKVKQETALTEAKTTNARVVHDGSIVDRRLGLEAKELEVKETIAQSSVEKANIDKEKSKLEIKKLESETEYHKLEVRANTAAIESKTTLEYVKLAGAVVAAVAAVATVATAAYQAVTSVFRKFW